MKPAAVALSRRTTGAVFTRPEVVAYMMLETQRAGGFRKWSGLRILEPSCGDGAFVLPIVDALLAEKILVVTGKGFGFAGYVRLSCSVDEKIIARSAAGFKRAMEIFK